MTSSTTSAKGCAGSEMGKVGPRKATDFDGRDVPAMRPEMRQISKVFDYPNNPRTHPPAQLALLCSLIKRFGFDQPIVVDEDGVILKGHGRKQAAILAGMDEVPVIVKRGLSEADKIAERIGDNQSALLSGWEKELLRGEIVRLQGADYDLELLGFGDAELVQFTTLPGPPSQFPAVGEDIDTEHECPKCHYRWSGSSAPAQPKANGKKKK